MPSRISSPIIAVNMNRVAGVDPSNVDNLFSMWTIFSKCAESLENGRRLENLSWRLWNRETFCCDEPLGPLEAIRKHPVPTKTATACIQPTKRAQDSSFSDVPELSTSVDSASSEDEWKRHSASGSDSESVSRSVAPRPFIVRSDSSDRYRGRGERHMTPINLAKIMEDIDRNKSSTEEWIFQHIPAREAARVPSADNTKSVGEVSESKCTHSVVRGFSPSRISSSCRSSTNHVSTTDTTLRSASPAKKAPAPVQKKNKPVFFIGSSSSSDEDLEDSYNTYKTGSAGEKRTSLCEKVDLRMVDDDDIISDDEAVSESILEDDEMEEEWESSSESGHDEQPSMFKRVESRPELLSSRRSLLSTMLHEPERAAAMATAAARCSATMRRSGSSREQPTHNTGLATNEESEISIPGSKPIKRNNSNIPPTLSPRTTRRNMLANELTESLRKNLLWERQQKNTTASAHLKRRHTAADVTRLAQFPQSRGKGCASKNNSWNNAFFDQGQYEYHAAGW